MNPAGGLKAFQAGGRRRLISSAGQQLALARNQIGICGCLADIEGDEHELFDGNLLLVGHNGAQQQSSTLFKPEPITVTERISRQDIDDVGGVTGNPVTAVEADRVMVINLGCCRLGHERQQAAS